MMEEKNNKRQYTAATPDELPNVVYLDKDVVPEEVWQEVVSDWARQGVKVKAF